MQYCYSNNGLSWRGVNDDYIAGAGEVLFSTQPTSGQLSSAFSGYSAAAAAAAAVAEANILFNGGLTITSTSISSLNGTYAVGANITANINAEITSILLNGTFADGGATLQWPDINGSLHTFSSTTEFKLFATAIAAFVSNINKYALGIITTPPSNAATIA